jgi:regulator of ribonuclease activity A
VLFKTADLCDARDDVRVCRTQFLSWGRSRSFEGPIRTVECFEDIALIRRLTEHAGGGAVLVIDGRGSVERALFGDAMAARMLGNGWVGVVVHGAIRDVAEIDSMQIGVKAVGTCPQRGSLRGDGGIDVPVSFGGTTFVPGEWLVADDDGVVLLAQRPSRE